MADALAAALRTLCVWVFLLLLALGATTAFAQTSVSGIVNANTHWTTAGGPYVVTGDLSVQGGAVLTVDAGVTIYMGAGTSLTVQAGGLKLNGTAADPVRVLSDKTRQGLTAAPGDWNQWVFGAGTTGTKLDHVIFEHGKGLVVNGSSPVFNYLDIRNQQGVAIAIDLAASPTGVGNKASGSNLNAVSVPAGDIVGSIRWGLRGIPYVITGGTLSVGSSPAITGVTPTSVEQGQTVTLTVSGSRLTGVSSASFDQSGLTLTPFGTGSSSQAFLQLKVDAAAPVGQAALRLQVDAGELVFPNAVTVTQPLPAITGIDPTVVLAGTGSSVITVTGRNFKSSSEVLFNSASVATQFVSSTELRATLPNQTATGSLQTQVRSPDPLRPGEYLLSNQVALSVQAPTPPSIGVEPAPIALPPDSKPREVTIRLSKADYRDNTLNFSISDTIKATVSPASVVIAAGQTTAKVTIVPKVAGTVSLVIDSPTLTRVSVPLFITADFRGANTSYAPAVGVVVQTVPGSVTKQVSLSDSVVGVSVGGVLTGVSPSAWAVGGSGVLTITGFAIPANAQVSVVPNTGMSLGAVSVSGDGTQLQVPVTTASDAPVGMRRIVVKDGAGKDIIFANPARSAVQLMTGLPTIDSIEPVVAARGTLVTLVIRGRNLQQGAVRVLPDTGMRVDASPQISADGTMLTTMIDVAADAPTGERVVQVATPAGASSSTVQAANRLTVVTAVRNAVTPITSRLVGVVVGEAATPTTATVQPGSSLVGLLVGAGISEVTPGVGVVGTDVVVTVRGAGLQAVSGVAFTPSTGLTIIGSPTANGPGTELTFTLRVDAGAAIGLRRLVLTAGGKPLASSRPTDGAFLISAPIPELAAVDPQILRTGQPADKFTIRGRNLANVSDVRIEPSTGITVSGPFEVNADGTVLTFNASAASGTASGVRTVIVTTAAGQSTSVQGGGNIIRVATQVGPTYSNVMSAAVGVNVGSVTQPPESVDGTLATHVVGVLVGTGAPTPESIPGTLTSGSVGLIVGPAGQTMAPTGWLQGASGTITVTGRGLDAVTAAAVVPDTGILLGTPTSSDGGATLSISVSVAPDAPQVLRELRLATGSGKLSFVKPEAARFGIGSMPTISSVSPIVFEQGKGAVITIRGSNLKGVSSIAFSPGGGVSTTSDIAWSTDGLGELLTVSVYVDSSAALGNRVVRLVVPGGITTATPSPANTINVVTPQ
jgi:hypothetical protein